MKWGRLGLAVITLVQFQTLQAQAVNLVPGQNRVTEIDSSLFPIETTPTQGTTVGDLFPVEPGIPAPKTPAPTPAPSTGAGQKPQTPGTTPTPTPVKSEFRCNLFENADATSILSAVNSLNQAVGSPSCGGTAINVQGVVDNNKKITDAVKALQGFLDNPATVQPENAATIVNSVDVAIRAANSLATTFANTDLMNKNCRDQMSGGQVALALNDIVNGLTPYALMAAGMSTGGVAIPFIVGGSVITGALSSMNKIITENSTKINDAQVRRAVVENACQFIRLDQKYKFLIKNRDEQVSKISKEISNSQRAFSARISNLSQPLNNLVNRKNALSSTSLSIDNDLAGATTQLLMDKAFVVSTNDEIKICQIGIQLAALTQEQDSYVNTMLSSVDRAMIAYGSTSIAEARALKFSGQIAINSLTQFANTQFTINSDFSGCAKVTKSFVETIEQSAGLSKRIVKLAQDRLDKELRQSPEYNQFQNHLNALNQKQLQAERVTTSLDNLKKYANNFAQSEIDAEMDRLRAGLFGQRTLGINSPVMAWFNYTQNLHRSAVTKFKDGLGSIRSRAYAMTKSGQNPANGSLGGMVLNRTQIDKDWDNAYQLRLFDAVNLKKGTKEYTNACRELQDVWSRWTTAVDHLSAVESFCGMIEPYIYDNRQEDRVLVAMCRGGQQLPNLYGASYTQESTLQQMKNNLVKEHTSAWALLLKSKVDALACPQPSL